MANYSFRKDLALSQEAVELVMNHLIDNDISCHELEGKEEQKYGDIRSYPNGLEEPVDIEVKFDIMAEKTGNLCFELSNGKKLTGMLGTKASEVYYVVPEGSLRKIFKFRLDKLRDYILEPANVIMKKGGDSRKFHLALVKADKIIEDDVAFDIVVVDNED